MCSKEWHMKYIDGSNTLMPTKCPECGFDLYSLVILLSDNPKDKPKGY